VSARDLSLGELDLHLLGEGRHRRLYEVLGAHPAEVEGRTGVRFAVWAPNARCVAVTGDFADWSPSAHPLRCIGDSGIHQGFVPGVAPGALYKFVIEGADGVTRWKSDPLARAMERPPGTASRVFASRHVWKDDDWMDCRVGRDWHREPVNVYEAHLGSWRREENAEPTYETLAPQLVAHLTRYGFTHLELLPIAEYPFDGSWGYQVGGYFAPTSRFGDPDQFRVFVDCLHRHGIGVIIDWVPAHFPRDDFALRRFDGTALFEHGDPRLGEHPDWGTLIFNYGRYEVRNFLIANALFWLREYHIDGLRVDAVASMLYRDYSREEGEWIPNHLGGRENLEAVSFLRELNDVIGEEASGAFTIAEESTAWPGVTRPTSEGGLGFTFKWNMGWMHDTLQYFSTDPVHRPYHQDDLTFAAIYEHTEHFLMPLSHDEVVHGKGSLYQKMPGDPWQKLANLRLLLAYQYTRPGKKLLFMGSELAPPHEWSHEVGLDWGLDHDLGRHAFAHFVETLGHLYREWPCLWWSDPDPEGFAWIDIWDRRHSVVSYRRRGRGTELVVILNATPVPRNGYRIGAPRAGRWREVLSSDAQAFGGSGYPTRIDLETEPVAMHGFDSSWVLDLPPLAALILRPEP
jgi:1,4-alpha-glucan branching enzyme